MITKFLKSNLFFGKHYMIFLFVFSSLNFFCQNITVQYEYIKHKNKSDLDFISDNTYLVINDENSMFYSEGFYKSDSIITSDNKNGIRSNFKNLPADLLGVVVRKNLKKKNLDLYAIDFAEYSYKYTEDPEIEWNITNTSKQIMGEKVFLATTSYAGRNYKAYFAPGIPVQDGPYKFCGLPGLILELYDTSLDHHFIAKGISTKSHIIIESILSKTKFIETTKDKFLKMKIAYEQAPMQKMRDMMNRTGITETTDKQGNLVSIPKLVEDMEKRMKTEFSTRNEIELYK